MTEKYRPLYLTDKDLHAIREFNERYGSYDTARSAKAEPDGNQKTVTTPKAPQQSTGE